MVSEERDRAGDGEKPLLPGAGVAAGAGRVLVFRAAWLLGAFLLGHGIWRLGLLLLLLFRDAPPSLVGGLAARDPILLFAVALGLACLVGRGPLRVLRRRMGIPLRPARDALVFAGILFLVGGPALLEGVPGPNRFGFYVTLAPGGSTRQIPASLAPAYRVTTNTEGYRDREWTLEGAERRGIVVGDSFVFGHGIDDPAGLLDRRLEVALAGRTGASWEVANLAATPSALWYYSLGVRDALDELRPEFVVVSVLQNYDLEPYEVQRLRHGLSPGLVGALRTFGLDQAVMIAGFRHGDSLARGGGLELKAARAAGREQAELLAAELGRRKIPLLFWEPLGKESALDGLRGKPGIRFLSWQDVPEAAALLGCSPEETAARWSRDGRLAFPGDGHPTALANGLIAEALAEALATR